MRAAIALPAIGAVDPESLLRALEVYALERLNFAEPYLVPHAEATGVKDILSFDRTIDRLAATRAATTGKRMPRPPWRGLWRRCVEGAIITEP